MRGSFSQKRPFYEKKTICGMVDIPIWSFMIYVGLMFLLFYATGTKPTPFGENACDMTLSLISFPFRTQSISVSKHG